MSQIITPLPADSKELASKNWYRAEALRRIAGELVASLNDIEDDLTRRAIQAAITAIEDARNLLAPQPQAHRQAPVHRVRAAGKE